jgi:hypothetical protein
VSENRPAPDRGDIDEGRPAPDRGDIDEGRPAPDRGEVSDAGSVDKDGSVLRWIASVAVALGLLFYGYLTYVYEHFYGKLSVEPSDVGLTYGLTLARSAGLILVVTVLVAVAVGATGFLLGAIAGSLADGFSDLGPSALLLIFPIALIAWNLVPLAAYPFTEPAREAEIAAKEVLVGVPVAPVRLYGRLTIMHLRADAAVIAPSGKPGASPVVDMLATKPHLLYLGQANGTTVLFDPGERQPVYVPTNTIVVRLRRPVARNGHSPLCVFAPTRWWHPWPLARLERLRPQCGSSPPSVVSGLAALRSGESAR